jgi:hypothetical protein
VKEAWAAKVMIAKVSMRVRRVAVRTELAVSTARTALAREWQRLAGRRRDEKTCFSLILPQHLHLAKPPHSFLVPIC